MNSSEVLQSNYREELSPPTPSLANAKEGSGDASPVARDAPETEPGQTEFWPGVLFAANQAHMLYGEGELERLERRFAALTLDERKAAIEGIKLGLETGEYADAHYVPTLCAYLKDKRWTAKLRPGPQKNGRPLDRKAAAREEFDRRLMEELQDAGRQIHD